MNNDPDLFSARQPEPEPVEEPASSSSGEEEIEPEESGSDLETTEEIVGDSPDFSDEDEEENEDEETPNDEALQDSEESEESEESEARDDALTEMRETLGAIHEEIANVATESRRNSRRVFDILKQFGTVLDALSVNVNAVHASARAMVAPTPSSTRGSDSALDTIELSDRVDRITAAFARAPEVTPPWWPPARRRHAAWAADRERLGDSFTILATHVRSLLTKAGLERIPCLDQIFDPVCMTAVEAVLRPELDDHTVVEELLPGWRLAGGAADPAVIRPAQVRVSRAQ